MSDKLPPVAVSEPVAIYQWREPAVSASWLDSSADDPREHLERLSKLTGVETRIVYTRPAEPKPWNTVESWTERYLAVRKECGDREPEGAREAHRSGYQSAVEMFAESPVDSIHAAYEEVLAWEALLADQDCGPQWTEHDESRATEEGES